MKKFRLVAIALLIAPLLVLAKQKTIIINSEQLDCVGFDNSKMKCLQYKEKGKDLDWQLLYQPIKGFKFVPGYLFTLLINENVCVKQSDTATSTNVNWTLVKVVRKERVPVIEYGELTGYRDGLGGEWLFSKMMRPGKTTSFNNGKEMIRFNDSTLKVSGKASCNSFFGTYSVNGHEIKFGTLGFTLIACPGLENENMMRKALQTVDIWEVQNGKLLLKAGDIIVFELKRIVKKAV
ncbi:MAG: META domain-containing protein [Chitinophagaceae bacterium]